MKKIVLFIVLTIALPLRSMQSDLAIVSMQDDIDRALTQILNKQYQEQMRIAKPIDSTSASCSQNSHSTIPDAIPRPCCYNKTQPGYYFIADNQLRLIKDGSTKTIFTLPSDKIKEEIAEITCNQAGTIAFHTKKEIWTITPQITKPSEYSVEQISQFITTDVHTIKLNNYGFPYLASINYSSDPKKQELIVNSLDGKDYHAVDISSFNLASPDFFIDFIHQVTMNYLVIICDGKQLACYECDKKKLFPLWKPGNDASLKIINNSSEHCMVTITKDNKTHAIELLSYEIYHICFMLLSDIKQAHKQNLCLMAHHPKSSIQDIHEIDQDTKKLEEWLTQQSQQQQKKPQPQKSSSWVAKHPWITIGTTLSLAAVLIYFLFANKQ